MDDLRADDPGGENAASYCRAEPALRMPGVVSMINDAGGNGFYTYNQGNLAIWSSHRSEPQNGGGVMVSLTFFNPGATATNGFGCEVYNSNAFKNQPCINECTDTCTNPPGGALTGILFNFGSGDIVSGSIAIYGWS